MANEQHIEWLLEGVEAWNARRQREDFIPDLSEAKDLREHFKAAGLLTENGRINLGGADLWRADLWRADLRGSDLRQAVLLQAVLERADLRGADLRWSDLEGADVRTVYSGADANDFSTPEYTDLSPVRYLTQNQLDTMRGDRGVILPEGLSYPDHWPEPQPSDASDTGVTDARAPLVGNSTETGTAADAPLARFRAQVRVLTSLGPVAREASAQTAAQIEWAIAEYTKEAGLPNQLPDELEAFHQMGAYLLDISKLLANLEKADATIAEKETQIEILEARVADLTAQVSSLNAALANTRDPAVKQVIVAAVGAAGGAVLTGIALTGGSHVVDDIRYLHDLIQSWGMSAPAPSPSLG